MKSKFTQVTVEYASLCSFVLLIKAKDDVKEGLHFEIMSDFCPRSYFFIPQKSKNKKQTPLSYPNSIHITPIMIEVNVGLEALES